MNRRQFLATLGLTLAATQLPIGVINAYPDFDPKHQYGDYVRTYNNIDAATLMAIQDEFAHQIKHNIPPRYRGRIEWIVQQPDHPTADDPLGQYGWVGWKYTPEMRKQ